MRVEQRIGRIDRIGQEYDEVWIYNYFYRDTIEDRVYQALKERINWFEAVVGSLQPILAEVNKMTRNLAMLPAARQALAFDEAMRRLQEEIEQEQLASLDLDSYLQLDEPVQGYETPVTLSGIERVLTLSAVTGHLFTPHETVENAYWLTWRGAKTAVTFNAEQYESHPTTLAFMSYGSALLDGLLKAVPEPETIPGHLARFEADVNWPICGWYDLRGNSPRPLNKLHELQSALEIGQISVKEGLEIEANETFSLEAASLNAAYELRRAQLSQRRRAILQAKARRILVKGALVEIALGQQRSLFDTDQYPTSFNRAAVTGLAKRGSEWQWLLIIAGDQNQEDLPSPSQSDSYFEQIRSLEVKALKAMFEGLSKEAVALAMAWQNIQQKGE